MPAGGKRLSSLKENAHAIRFIYEVFKHCKAIAADDEGAGLLKASYPGNKMLSDTLKETDLAAKGIIVNVHAKGATSKAKDFIKAIAQHRFWNR